MLEVMEVNTLIGFCRKGKKHVVMAVLLDHVLDKVLHHVTYKTKIIPYFHYALMKIADWRSTTMNQAGALIGFQTRYTITIPDRKTWREEEMSLP